MPKAGLPAFGEVGGISAVLRGHYGYEGTTGNGRRTPDRTVCIHAPKSDGVS